MTSSVSLSTVLGFQVVVQKSASQMGMPMHMTDMWVLVALFAAILILAVTVPLLLFTRPSRRAPSTAPAPVQPTQPMVNSPAEVAFQEVENPATKTNQLKKALEVVRPTLTQDERRIVNEVVKAGGEILQSDLPEKSDFSKATVSKLVKSLETMGVITRQKHKWTYWIKLSDKLVSESKNA